MGTQGDLRIGTSGWHYKHWRGPFYPTEMAAAEYLRHYAQFFDAAEINRSFYSLPTRAVFAEWAAAVPKNFIFAVKGSRFLTHMKKLKDPREPLQRIFERIDGLGEKLGPILFQLPPRWSFNADRLAAFLEALPKGHRYVFEFREPSWWSAEALALLRRANAAACIFQLAGFQSPIEHTADFVYVRLHGPTEKAYQGCYTRAQLKRWAGQIRGWRSEGRDVYFFFDNDHCGYAAQNARDLRALAGQSAILKEPQYALS